MSRNVGIRRIFAALLISVALNGVLIAVGPWTEQHGTSAMARVTDLLGRPSAAFTEWVVPGGHDAVHILGAIAVSFMSSVIFYGVLAWAVLTAWAWRGARRNDDKSLSISP